MGKEIAGMAEEMDHEIIARIDNENDWEQAGPVLAEADAAIVFSTAASTRNNILRCFEHGLPVVCGTTGWDEERQDVEQLCIREEKAFFYASNFSPGMNMMFELNERLAELMSRHPDYRILIEEEHHSGKKDSPSGTAITLAKDILHHHPVKDTWVNRPSSAPNELEIISIRRNHVPGTHYVKYDSDIDSLEIRHTAHSREGFALGALLAAEWIRGKKGVFGMKDLLNDSR